MKRIVMVMVLLAGLVIAGSARAGSWNIHCENDSCVASQGALKVYWMAGPRDIYSLGKLTGVEGIPISIDDYQSVEKKIENTIEKSITRKKGADAGIKADAPDGPTSGTAESKENLFTKKKSMSQNRAVGKKVHLDYTLAFVEWLGDTRHGGDHSVKKYWRAAEDALEAYKNGNIENLIERFFIARNAGNIEDVAVNTKLTDENKDLVLTKYIGLTNFPGVSDVQRRYALASSFVYDLSNPDRANQAARITEEFKNDLKALEILAKPGQTALKLFKKNKELAFVKWLGDTVIFEYIKDPRDRYIIALSLVRRTNEDDKRDTADFREKFEAAIKNKDQSVQVVTIKGSPIPIIPIAVVAISGLLLGVGIFVKRKKKSNQQGVKDAT